jgi:hypothetical protein
MPLRSPIQRTYVKSAVIGLPVSNNSLGRGIHAWSTRASATPCSLR